MRKKLILFLLLAGNIVSLAARPSYTNGVITPTPAKQGKNAALLINPASIKIITSATAVKSLKLGKKILLEKLKSLPQNNAGKKISLTIAKVNDAIWRKTIFSEITTLPPQGYKLKFVADKNGVNIYAIGADNRGVFYAMTSLVQLLYAQQGKAYINAADISDNPVWLKRYTGGYNPVSTSHYEKLAMYKISGYGIQHRYDWKLFSPEKRPIFYRKKTYQQAFEEIKKFRANNGDLVDFMLLLNIYVKSKPAINISNPAEVKLLTDKCVWAAQYVQHIMIQVDDYAPTKEGKYSLLYSGERKNFKNAGDAHGYLVKKVYSAVKKYHPQVKISFCSAPYSLGGHDASNESNRQYLASLAQQLPADVPVVWTGAHVETQTVTADSYRQYQALLKSQQLLLWDNSSCIGATPLNIWETSFFPTMVEKDNSTVYINGHGFSFFWTWLFAINANDYLWNPKAYNSSKSYAQIFFELKGKKLPGFVDQTRKDLIKLQATWKRSERAKLAKNILLHEKEFKTYNLPFKKIKGVAKSIYQKCSIKTASISVPRVSKDFDLHSKEAANKWKLVPVFKLAQSDKKIKYPTIAKVAYTPDNFYMQFTCFYSKKPNGKLIKLNRDSSQKDSLDRIIIGLQAPLKNQKAGWIRVDIAGSIFDNEDWRNFEIFNPKLQIKRQLLADRWILTIKIPLADLINHITWKTISRNDSWRVNFIRVNNIDNEISSWSPVSGKSISAKVFFGKITFK